MAIDGSVRKVTAPPTCIRKSVEPVLPLLEHGNDGGMCDKANRADFARGSTEHSSGFKDGSFGGHFQQRGVGAWADDLQETEAVDRGPFERFGQELIDRLGCGQPDGLAVDRRQVDADRPADPVPPDCGRGRARSGDRQLGRMQVPVDIDQGHCGRQRHAQLAAWKANNSASGLVEQIRPTRGLQLVRGRWELKFPPAQVGCRTGRGIGQARKRTLPWFRRRQAPLA